MIRLIALILLAMAGTIPAMAQSYQERAMAYVKQYAPYAIADQRETGVPASITLAQGLLETEAGNSELVRNANNHFGIKCKNGWQGPSYAYTDDAKDECFKKYGSALESYNDHSAHLLRNPRYKILFTYSPTDYAKWAHGIKKCGYATNPRYAQELIKLIELFRLQEYTYAALDSNYQIILPEETAKEATSVAESNAQPQGSGAFAAIAQAADSARKAIAYNDSIKNAAIPMQGVENKIQTVNGLKAVFARKGDVLLQYAIKYKVHYPHLLEMNDLPDEPLAFDSYLYLEKKLTQGLRDTHPVKKGETMRMIAQQEGVQLKKLLAYNKMQAHEDPQAGETINLRELIAIKPKVQSGIKVYTEETSVYDTNPNAGLIDTATQSNNTVAIHQPSATKQEVSIGFGFEAPEEEEDETEEEVKPLNKTTDATPAKPSYRKPEQQTAKPKKAAPAPKKPKIYTVKKGETAYSIAKRYDIDMDDLIKWNKLKGKKLQVGQKLKLSRK